LPAAGRAFSLQARSCGVLYTVVTVSESPSATFPLATLISTR
jgi:hypothetical protein